MLEGNGREVTHLDVRGRCQFISANFISQTNPRRWGVVGNRREALLWDLRKGKIDEKVKPVPVKVASNKDIFDHLNCKNLCLRNGAF